MSKGKYLTHVEPKLKLIEAWARDGLLNDHMARKLGVSPSTFYEYVKKYPELSETLKRGKEVVDVEVENALLKRALGYRYDEVTKEAAPYTITEEVDGKSIERTEYRMTVTKIVTKEVQADTTAQIFWLKNRKPKEWRDRQEIKHSGGVVNTNKNVDLTALSDEELEKEIAKYDGE